MDGARAERFVARGRQDFGRYAAAIRGRRLFLAGSTSSEAAETSDAYVAELARDGELEPAFGGGIQTAHFDLEYTSFLGIAVNRSGVAVAGYDFGEAPETLPPSDALVVELPVARLEHRAVGELNPQLVVVVVCGAGREHRPVLGAADLAAALVSRCVLAITEQAGCARVDDLERFTAHGLHREAIEAAY